MPLNDFSTARGKMHAPRDPAQGAEATGAEPASDLGMQTRPLMLRPTTFVVSRSTVGRTALDGQTINGESDTALGEYQDSLATSKLERLADELRALGIDF